MSETRTYRVSYSVETFYDIEVDRPVDISRQELINSITRDEISGGDESGGWDGIKDAWRQGNVSLILDEEGQEIDFPE